MTRLLAVSGAAPARVEGFEVGYLGGDGVERRVPLAIWSFTSTGMCSLAGCAQRQAPGLLYVS